ncbi:TPA: hypothetical protein ACH3X2_010580 [Trebouxia sp. C0005]
MSDADAPARKKAKAGGRPIDERIWKHFKQIALPSEKAKTAKRNHDTECRHCSSAIIGKPYKMKEHLSLFDHQRRRQSTAAMASFVLAGHHTADEGLARPRQEGMCIGLPLAVVPHPSGGVGWGWGWGYWQSRRCEDELQLQGKMVRLMPMSTNLGGLDCREKAAINQCMVQAVSPATRRRLSVAAGPETGLSWSVPRGPACA